MGVNKIYGGRALRIGIGIVVMISFMVGVVNATPTPGLWKGTWGGGLDFVVSESGDSIINYTKSNVCTLPWPPYAEYINGGPIPIIDDKFDDGRFSGTFTSSTNANGYFIPTTVIYGNIQRDCSGGDWSASLVAAVPPSTPVPPTPVPPTPVPPTPVPTTPVPPTPTNSVPEYSYGILIPIVGILFVVILLIKQNKL